MLCESKLLPVMSSVSCIRKKLLTDFNTSFHRLFGIQGTRLICWHCKVRLLKVQTVHLLGKRLVWGSSQPLLSETEVSWQRTKPVCNQKDCSDWARPFHKSYFMEGIIPLKLKVLDDWKNSGRQNWKQCFIFQTLSEFQFCSSQSLLEIREQTLLSGECLLALKWLKFWLNILTNQISLS